MNKDEVAKRLFTSREHIKCSPNGNSIVGTLAPAGTIGSIHKYTKNSKSFSANVKFNRSAIFLDDFFLNKLTNVMISRDGNQIFTEIKIKNGIVKSYLKDENGKIDLYVSLSESVRAIIYPFVVYFSLKDNDEFVGLFSNIEKDIKLTGVATPSNLATFCESFYYLFVKKSFTIHELTETELNEVIMLRTHNVISPFRNDDHYMEFETFSGLSDNSEVSDSEMTPEKIYEKALRGEFKINYQWDEKVLDLIPSHQKLEQYVPNEFFAMALLRIYKCYSRVLERIENGIKEKDALEYDDVNTLTFGNPGTGKTAGYYAIGAALGVPVYTCTSNPNTEEDEFQGKTKFINGIPESVMTPCLKGFIYGGIVLGEEIDLPDAGVVMGALGQAVESPHIMEAYGYDVKFRHPLCAFCFTKNNDANGSNQMNEAFNNRLRQTYKVNDVSRENALKIFEKRGFPAEESEWVYSVYEKAIKFLEGKSSYRSIIPNLSIRTCIGALENIQDGWGPRKSVENAIINKISSVNLKAGDEFKDILFVSPIPNFKEKNSD